MRNSSLTNFMGKVLEKHMVTQFVKMNLYSFLGTKLTIICSQKLTPVLR
jgi:hypothetical protein